MNRKIVSPQQLHDIIQGWIKESGDHLDGDCKGCHAPAPVELQEPEDGCNWVPSGYVRNCPVPCHSFLNSLIVKARARFNVAF